jgi:aryl-alcohol dehydrogenase
VGNDFPEPGFWYSGRKCGSGCLWGFGEGTWAGERGREHGSDGSGREGKGAAVRDRRSLNSLKPEAGSAIAVFGTGTVGMSAIMAARVAGCTTIIGIDIKPNRLELARELGATHIINGGEEDSVERIKEITGGGANYSLETTASPAVFRQSVDCLTQLGTCGLIGAAAVGTEARVDISTMLLFGHRIQGIIEGDAIPDMFIPRLLELYVQGRFPFDRLVRFYELDEINQAAEDSESGEVLKAILRMPS